MRRHTLWSVGSMKLRFELKDLLIAANAALEIESRPDFVKLGRNPNFRESGERDCCLKPTGMMRKPLTMGFSHAHSMIPPSPGRPTTADNTAVESQVVSPSAGTNPNSKAFVSQPIHTRNDPDKFHCPIGLAPYQERNTNAQ